MTYEEFIAKEAEILSVVPPEFRSAMSYYAYQQGHAYGYQEVIGHLEDLVDSFMPSIVAYTKRLGENKV
jgi:hypothetical protein